MAAAKVNKKSDEAILKRIRDRYDYATEAWREIRDEQKIDLNYIAGNVWDTKDRKARESAGRPCINHDELNQYVNHAINNARQNKRGIKVDPVGATSEKQSELKQDIIRTAEYRSRAQSAYLTGYQSMLEGSYGVYGISRRYVANQHLTPQNFNQQEITFRTFKNPNSVLWDPDCKEEDWSDQKYCFVLDPITREEFKRQHPKAQVTDFSTEQMQVASNWITDKNVLRAEYWEVEETEKTQYLVGGQILDELPENVEADGERTVTTKTVMQYITNGIEILKRRPQPGTMIPIIPLTGLERYVDRGEGPKRELSGIVRLARDPQLTLAFLCSQQMEEAGLTPKVPYKGYVGQFETDKTAWDTITKIPRAYVQVDPIVDAATGQVLPMPVREQFTPNFAAYEVAKDSARRAIQAAMGISPLPTAAQRSNEKSGVALENIEKAQDIGSFHFVDGLERGLMYGGRVMDEYIAAIHVDEQEMMLLKADNTHRRVKLNTDQPYLDEKTQKLEHFLIDDSDQTITIASGPSYDSQRQEVKEFIEKLLASLKNLPLSPPQMQEILAMAVKMSDLGPMGDQLADIISPPPPPGGKQPDPAAMAAIAQAHQLIQGLQAELQKLQLDKAGHVIQGQFEMAIEKMRIEADIAKAEIATKAQNMEERMQFVEDAWKQLHGQAHDAGLQADAQQHQAAQATQAQGATADAATQAQDHAAGQADADREAAAMQQQPEA